MNKNKVILSLVLIVLFSTVAGGAVLSTVTVKPDSLSTKTTMAGESEIVGSDYVNCNSGYCEIIVDGKNLVGDTEVLDLSFSSEHDLEVVKTEVYVKTFKSASYSNLTCETAANKSLINCVDNPYSKTYTQWDWLNSDVFSKKVYDNNFKKIVDQYYSPVGFFKDEDFKVRYTVKNILGKNTKYTVGIGDNLWDPLINSSSLYSTNSSWTTEDNATTTTCEVADSGIELTSSGGLVGLFGDAFNRGDSATVGGNWSDSGAGDSIESNQMKLTGGTTTLSNMSGVGHVVGRIDLSLNTAGEAYFYVKDGSNFPMGIQVLNPAGGIIYYRSDGAFNKVLRTDYPYNVMWNFSFRDIDFDADTYSIYVNGVANVTDIPFHTVADNIDWIQAQTGGGVTAYYDDYWVGNESATTYDNTNKVFHSNSFDTAITMNNFSIAVTESEPVGANVYNVSCDGGSNWVTNVTPGTSTNCAVAGTQLEYTIDLCGNSSSTCTVSELNISFSAAPDTAVRYVIGTPELNSTVWETSTQNFKFNITWNTTAVDEINTTFQYNGVNYTPSETIVNNGTAYWNITTFNVSLIVPLAVTNASTISSFWDYTILLSNTTTITGNTSNSSQTVEWAYFITSLSINNSARETSNQSYNFTIENKEGVASLIGLMQINNTNYTISNSTNNFGTSLITPLIKTNTTNITIKPYLNITYNTSLIRTLSGQDQELEYSYFISSLSLQSSIFEMKNNSYNISVTTLESLASITGILDYNGTNYTMINTSNEFIINRTSPLVQVNDTNITLTPYISVSYAGIVSNRSSTAQTQGIDFIYYVSSTTGNTTIFEGELSNITAVVTNITDNAGSYSIKLDWNSTNFTMTRVYNDTWNYNKYTDAINVTTLNISIRAYLNVTDGTNYLMRSGDTIVQTIKQMQLDNCTTGTIELLNYTFWEEKSKTTAVTVDEFGFYINYYSNQATGAVNRTFNQTYADISQFRFCAVSPDRSYVVDIDSFWKESGFDTREYRVDNGLLTNVTTSLVMFLLDTTNSTEITLTVTDSNDIKQEDVYVFVYQHNIVNKSNTLLGSEVTDVDGKAVFNLDVTDQYYVFQFFQAGVLKLTSEPQKLTETAYTFRLIDSPTTLFTTYRNLRTTDRNLAYDNSTKVVSFSFNDASNLTSSVCMQVQLINQSLPTLLNQQCSSAASGNLTYTVTFDNSNYRAVGYAISNVDNKQYPFSVLDFKTKFLSDLGFEGLFWGGLIIMILGGVGFLVAKKPSIGLAFAMIGILAGTWQGWFEIGTTAVMGIVIGIIIMVIYLRD